MEDCLNKIGIVYKRPWGYYKTLIMDHSFQCKVICVHPKGKLSLQKHFHRSEHWVVVKGSLLVTKGKNETLKTLNDHIFIEKEEVHRIENTTDSDAMIIEIQVGDYLGEDDIVRLEDIYGRQ